MAASSATDLTKRLALFGITEETRTNVEMFRLVMNDHLEGIIYRFYRHIMSFPEGKRLIGSEDRVPVLAEKQREHWRKLFSCRFDTEYAESAQFIGMVHLRAGVAPYLYIAGYNFFLCELTKLAASHYAGSMVISGVLSSITRIISLDMDLALSVYTREMSRLVAAKATKEAIARQG